MKKANFYLMIKTFLISSILAIILLTSGCTTYQIPDEVCTYGTVTCETGQYVCENFEIPEPICFYFNVACTNLQILCSTEPGTPQYETALKNLRLINREVQTYIAKQPGKVPN